MSKIALRSWVTKYLFALVTFNVLGTLVIVCGVATGRMVLSERVLISLLSLMAAQATPMLRPVIRFLFGPGKKTRSR